MTADRERDIERICQAALEREGSVRVAFLAEACAGDAALQRDVESLLAQESQAAGFMSTPAAALASGPMREGTSFIGRQLGPYLIQARLGAGGMGEVYRAHDAKLGRDVAIKILPRIFTSDPERLARFEREARLLAALNHPNIGAIYGLEDVDGVPSLVLELVEGETLADRLAKGPLPVSDALKIASQIAEALEAAHERGIVHRDLKPHNIVLHDLAVKVLDFGLAKAVVGDAAGPDLLQSPTITSGGTKEGIILGTAAYMSPGQARGRPVDKRTDVWAFGCVLYEMLTGRLAFPGDTLSDTIAAILQAEPDWRALPETTPAGIRRLLRRCLEKDPTRRLRDIADARLDIEEALTAPARSQTVESPSRVRQRPTGAAWVLAAIGTAALIGALGVPYFRGTRASAERAVRFTFTAPPNTVLPRPSGGMFFALSPDSRRLVFAAERAGTVLLWVRSLDALEAQSLPGTEAAGNPIWSPDNRTVAFFADGKLKAIDVAGGPTRTLCEIPPVGFLYGGSWSPDGGTIVFAVAPDGGLFSVPANGGSPTALANPGATPGEGRLFPAILPDGQHFVYLSSPSNVAWLGSLDSREPAVRLLNSDSQVEYVASGYLVFVRRGTLMAQRFDAQHARLAGDAVRIAEGVTGSPGYGSAFATSLSGTLVYQGDPLNVPTQLRWVDRTGRWLNVAGKPERHRNPEISPDGKGAVMEVVDSQNPAPDIWHLEFERGVTTRLTSDPGNDVNPVWSPDGRWIMYSSDRSGGVPQLYKMRVDGTGGEERVLKASTAMIPYSWAPDGLLVYQSRPAFKLGVLPLSNGGVPHLLDESRPAQGAGQVSPNGRWLAYVARVGSETSDRRQLWDVFVQSFPIPGPKVRVSTNGATSPRWSRDGRELFFYAADGRLMAVPVKSDGAAPEVGAATALFEPSLVGGAVPQIGFKQQYDVAKDGRFLLNVPVEPVNDQSFTVVVNWTAGMTR
jgi:serine/threonine protein kinase/Tol biopolymer transport system component